MALQPAIFDAEGPPAAPPASRATRPAIRTRAQKSSFGAGAPVAARQYISQSHLNRSAAIASTKQTALEAGEGKNTCQAPACLRTIASYTCGHQASQSSHREGCEGGRKCAQCFEARVLRKVGKLCRVCTTAVAPASETWEEVLPEPAREVVEEYVLQSGHRKFLQKLDEKILQRGENLLMQGGMAVLQRVALHLAKRRIEKRLVACGKTRRLEEGPVVVVDTDEVEDPQGGDVACELIEVGDEDWVEIDRKEGNMAEA